MVSRLFGRSKKNPTPQEPQPPILTPNETEDEGFTILGGTPQTSQMAKNNPNSIYPALSGYPQPPGKFPCKTLHSDRVVEKLTRKPRSVFSNKKNDTKWELNLNGF